jgi:hypothetical protein
VDLLSPLLIVEGPDLRDGLRLFEEDQQLGSFDAVLVAAAHAVGAEALVPPFPDAGSIQHLTPDVSGVRRLPGDGGSK